MWFIFHVKLLFAFKLIVSSHDSQRFPLIIAARTRQWPNVNVPLKELKSHFHPLTAFYTQGPQLLVPSIFYMSLVILDCQAQHDVKKKTFIYVNYYYYFIAKAEILSVSSYWHSEGYVLKLSVGLRWPWCWFTICHALSILLFFNLLLKTHLAIFTRNFLKSSTS